MVSDKLLINLKILGKIEKNGKISRSCDGLVNLDTNSYFQGLWRTFTNDSRRQTLFEINNIVSELESVFISLYNSRHLIETSGQTEKIINDIKTLLDESTAMQEGISNLRFTYISDINTTAQLDVVLIKLEAILHEANQKYSYYTYNTQKSIGFSTV
jgi:hypothetical protein